jgi:competence protein ComEC
LCGLVLLAGITQCARRQTVRFRLINVLILAFAGLTLGFTWSALLAERNLAQSLPAEWEGRDLTLTGTIDSLPDHFEQGVRFNFLVERVQGDGGSAPVVPQHVALAWYAALRNGEIQSVGQIMPGARWRLTVRLQRPHGNANPYGFDYEVWLLEQNLRATGYVRNAASNSELDPFVPGFGNAVQRCRDWLRARIMSALAGQRYAGVIVALVVGDQRLVSQADWQVFNRTGIGHLISISGLHITMVAGMFAALASYLWRRSFFTGANLPLQLPAQKFAALAGVLTALLYVLLAGFGVPAQRTLYMVAVVAAALWSGHLTSVSHVLCAALGVVLVLDPWAALWPGFWLSFGAPAHRCRGLTLANLAHHAA